MLYVLVFQQKKSKKMEAGFKRRMVFPEGENNGKSEKKWGIFSSSVYSNMDRMHV